MSNLTDFARGELERSGLFEADSDYDGTIGRAVLELIETFSRQGHSGGSAALTIDLLYRLLLWQPLTPLTYEADEWVDVTDIAGETLWQNRRNPRIFSLDRGATHFNIEDMED